MAQTIKPARTEAEKRLHRCCMTGHRPQGPDASEEAVKAWLSNRIDAAVADGYRTFISGMSMGVDIWAGQMILQRKEAGLPLRLICAVPWPGYTEGWTYFWDTQFRWLLDHADLVKTVSKTYHDDVYHLRNKWMVDHSSRLIAYYDGTSEGTWDAIEYAVRQKVEVVCSSMRYVDEFREVLE